MPTYDRTEPTHERLTTTYSDKSGDLHRPIRTDGGRKSVTFKVDAETLRDIDAEADERDITRSEYLRELLDSRHKTDDLRQEIEEHEQTIERLQNEKRLLIEKREEHTELVEYVEEERELRKQNQRQERKEKTAPVWRRAKWWLFGQDLESE